MHLLCYNQISLTFAVFFPAISFLYHPLLSPIIIITQIGRGNKPSADLCLFRVAEDVDPYKYCVKFLYENWPKRVDFFALIYVADTTIPQVPRSDKP